MDDYIPESIIVYGRGEIESKSYQNEKRLPLWAFIRELEKELNYNLVDVTEHGGYLPPSEFICGMPLSF